MFYKGILQNMGGGPASGGSHIAKQADAFFLYKQIVDGSHKFFFAGLHIGAWV